MRHDFIFVAICWPLLLAAALYAQSDTPASAPPAAPASNIAVDVNVVTLPVTVRDKHGEIARNLTKDDFILQEDNHPATIRYFSQETNLPLTLGLLADTSGSVRNVLDQERAASKSFLNQMLATPKDRAFLVHFDREVELLEDLTSDKEKLASALNLLQPESSYETVQNGDSGSTRMNRRAGTLLYDAIFLASDELMQKQTGRKALIVMSDGVDRGSKESLNGAIEAAQRAETVVYGIYFTGHENENQNNGFGRGMGRGGGFPGGFPGGYPGGRGGGYPRPSQPARIDGKKILQQIADQTGGRFYQISKRDPVDKIYSEIAEELRMQYMMGFTPDKNDQPGYHSIHLTTKKKDFEVETRTGYYATAH